MNQSQRIGPCIYLINSVCFLVITLVACSISEVGTKSSPSNGNQIYAEEILAHLPQLDLSHPPQAKSESLQAYNHFYGLDYDNASHFMGYFQSEDKTIWSQVFFPVRPVGTIFLIHGYFDHSGTLKNLIADSLKNGFVVAVFDLPGHGLSSGDRGAIESFLEYVSVLQTFINKCVD